MNGQGKGLLSDWLKFFDFRDAIRSALEPPETPDFGVREPHCPDASLHLESFRPLGCSVTSEGRVGERGARVLTDADAPLSA